MHQGGPFRIFLTSVVANIKKLKGVPFGGFLPEKSLTMPKKPERGTLLNFITSIVAKHQKIERGPFEVFFRKSL